VLEIYNTLGEKVYESAQNNDKQVIDLSTSPKGIYFVEIKIAEKNIRKLLIQQ
jgi:hypothetical protein